MARLPDIPLPEQQSETRDSQLNAGDSDSGIQLPPGGLDAIRKEMGGRRTKQLRRRQIIGAAIFLLLLAGGYALVSYYRVYIAKTTYFQLERQTDLKDLALYAPEQWAKIRRIRKEAGSGFSFFGAGRIAARYNEATKTLAAAIAVAEDVRNEYQRLRKQFLKKKEEAKRNGLNVYLPALWKRLEQIERTACTPGGTGFDPKSAIQTLRQGIALLDEQNRYLADLKQLAVVRHSCEQLLSGVNMDEWKTVAPRETSQLQSRLARARSSADARQWKDAVAAYRQAEKLAQQIRSIVEAKRAAATKALAALQADLGTADQEDLARSAASVWTEIKQKAAAAEAAFKAWKYEDAKRLADQARQQLSETRKTIEEARAGKKILLAKLKSDYEKLAAQDAILRRNWEKDWAAVVREYRVVQNLATGDDYVAFLNRAKTLEKTMEDLSRRIRTIGQVHKQVKQEFEQAYAAVSNRTKVFQTNAPDLWERFQRLVDEARTDEEVQQLSASVEAYRKALSLLKQMGQVVANQLKEGDRLRKECDDVMRRFRKGIRLFGGANGRRVLRLLARARQAWNQGRYRDAVEMLRNARKLLPRGRFERGADGAIVRDYRLGVVWAADGRGPGCLGGDKVTWYEARRRLFNLRFGGRSDWRLPTDDELLSLARLSEKQLDEFFPHTERDEYWASTQLPDDVDHALCVDFAKAARRVCLKNQPHFVRAIARPE